MVAAETDLPVIGVSVESHALRAAARILAYGDAVLTGTLTEPASRSHARRSNGAVTHSIGILGGEQLGRMLTPCGWVTAWSSSKRSRTQRRVKSPTSNSSAPTTICASSASSARNSDQLGGIEDLLHAPDVALYLFGKAHAVLRRRMGHLTVLGRNADDTLHKAERGRRTLHRIDNRAVGGA